MTSDSERRSLCERRHESFNFCHLPQELQAHIVYFADARTAWQVAQTCKALRDLCLRPSIVSAHIAGSSSPLALGNLRNVSQEERMSLLIKSFVANKNGRLPAKHTLEMQKARSQYYALEESVISPEGRFTAILAPRDFTVWDTFYDRCVLHDTLGLQLGDDEILRRHWRTTANLGDDFLVVFRTSDTEGPVERPTLFVEFIQFARSAGSAARVSARRALSYGLDDGLRYWGWYSSENKQIRVLETADGYRPGDGYCPGKLLKSGRVFHWNVPAVLTADKPDETFYIHDGICTQLAVRGWNVLMTQSAKYKGVPGARIKLPARMSSSASRCTFSIDSADEVNAFEDPYESALQDDDQSVPIDRGNFYFHVWDAVTQRGITWPPGSKFEFSEPDDQRIDFLINVFEWILQVKDEMGNCWKANRRSTFMQADQQWRDGAAMYPDIRFGGFREVGSLYFGSDYE